MVRSPLTNVVADIVDDRLRAHGFTRDGKSWYVTNELGDYAIVQLSRMPRLPGMERFHVETGVVPAPWRSWMRAFGPLRRRAGPPEIGHALLQYRVDAPDGGPVGLGWTVSSPAEATRTGKLVADLLTAGPIDKLRALLDRAQLHARLSEDNRDTPAIRAAFVAESGPSTELNELLAEFVDWQPDNSEFVVWAKAYAAEQRRI